MAVDASDVGVGAFLLQDNNVATGKPVSYFSKKLNKYQEKVLDHRGRGTESHSSPQTVWGVLDEHQRGHNGLHCPQCPGLPRPGPDQEQQTVQVVPNNSTVCTKNRARVRQKQHNCWCTFKSVNKTKQIKQKASQAKNNYSCTYAV